jgi:hypothetical protein
VTLVAGDDESGATSFGAFEETVIVGIGTGSDGDGWLETERDRVDERKHMLGRLR